MSKPTQKQNIFKAGVLFLLAAVLTGGLVFFGFNSFQQDDTDEAQAAQSVPVVILEGAVCKGLAIDVEYGNPGDRDMSGAQLTIDISPSITLLDDTLSDNLGTGTDATVSSTLISDVAGGGRQIVYAPGSAGISAGGTAGTSDVPAGEVGFFRFVARINAGAVGIIPDAVKATLTNSDSDLDDLESSIWIQLTSTDASGCLEEANVGNGVCTPATLNAGDSTECVYDLLDNNGDPIPSGNSPVGLDGNTYGFGQVPTSSIDGATGDSDQCYVEDRNGYKLVCENVPTDGAQPGPDNADVDFPDGTVADNRAQVTFGGDVPPTDTPIGAINIGDGVCNPNIIEIGNTTICDYPLVDQSGNQVTGAEPVSGNARFVLNDTNLVSEIDTTTGGSSPCELNSQTAGWFITCRNVSTTDGTAGGQNVDLAFTDGSRAEDKASVTLTEPVVVTTDDPYGCQAATYSTDCRLYFIGLDDAPLNWNDTTYFNDDYPLDQKFKDGKADAVFDNIKRADGNLIADGSTCVFDFYRYSEDQVLRSFTSTTSGGECQVTLPLDDQTVNYYSVVVRATDINDGQIMQNQDRLVLAVGGDGSRQDVIVDI
jgi:hypothetical protein